MALDGAQGVAGLRGGGTAGIVDIEIDPPVSYVNGGTNATSGPAARHNLLSIGLAGNAVGDIWYRTGATAVGRLGTAGKSAGDVLTLTAGLQPDWAPPSGGPGGGISALTGDVTASGSGSVAATVARIQGQVISSTAPNAGEILQFTAGQWTPQPIATGGGTVNAGTAAQIAQYPAGGGASVSGVTISGDATIAQGGVLTVTQIRGQAWSTTPPTNDQVPRWSTALSQWVPAAAATGGGVDTVDVAVIANQTTPTQLTAQLNVVTGDGAVRLPVAVPGEHCFVRNDGTNPIDIRPQTTARINNRANDEAVDLISDSTIFFKAVSATRWVTVP